MEAFINKNSRTFYKPRNEFSEGHNDLPKQLCMFDIDHYQGRWIDIENTSKAESATYVEYKCLSFDKNGNKFNNDRIKFIAFFEWKHHYTNYVISKLSLPIGTAVWANFMMAKQLNARYFIVMGTNGKPPFYFLEYIEDENYIKYPELNYVPENRENEINDYWKNILLIK